MHRPILRDSLSDIHPHPNEELMLFAVRKIVTFIEEIHHDLGPVREHPAV